MIDLSNYGDASAIRSVKGAPFAVRRDILDGRAIYRLDSAQIPAMLRMDLVMIENNLRAEWMRLRIDGTNVENLFSVSKVLPEAVLLRLEGHLAGD